MSNSHSDPRGGERQGEDRGGCVSSLGSNSLHCLEWNLAGHLGGHSGGTSWLTEGHGPRSSCIHPGPTFPTVRLGLKPPSSERPWGRKAPTQAAPAQSSGGSRLITKGKPVNGAGGDVIFTPLAARSSIKARGFSVQIISIFSDCRRRQSLPLGFATQPAHKVPYPRSYCSAGAAGIDLYSFPWNCSAYLGFNLWP